MSGMMSDNYYKYMKYKKKYIELKKLQNGGHKPNLNLPVICLNNKNNKQNGGASSCKTYNLILKDDNYYYLHNTTPNNKSNPTIEFITVKAEEGGIYQTVLNYLQNDAQFDDNVTVGEKDIVELDESKCIYQVNLPKQNNIEHLSPNREPLTQTFDEINKTGLLKAYYDAKFVKIDNYNAKFVKISNYSATCYGNAAMQMLYRIPEIREFTKHNYDSNECTDNLRIFINFINEMKTGYVVDKFIEKNNIFAQYFQSGSVGFQDIHEFLNKILDTLRCIKGDDPISNIYNIAKKEYVEYTHYVDINKNILDKQFSRNKKSTYESDKETYKNKIISDNEKYVEKGQSSYVTQYDNNTYDNKLKREIIEKCIDKLNNVKSHGESLDNYIKKMDENKCDIVTSDVQKLESSYKGNIIETPDNTIGINLDNNTTHNVFENLHIMKKDINIQRSDDLSKILIGTATAEHTTSKYLFVYIKMFKFESINSANQHRIKPKIVIKETIKVNTNTYKLINFSVHTGGHYYACSLVDQKWYILDDAKEHKQLDDATLNSYLNYNMGEAYPYVLLYEKIE